jgi:ActR/RegA family two-component response regulator
MALAILGATNADEVRLKYVVEQHIKRVLGAADDNMSLAAKLLGMHRRSLQRHALRKRLAARRRKKRRRT